MNTIRELEQQEKYKNMLKRKNKEIKRLNNIINELSKEKDRLGSLFYERNEENIRLNNIVNRAIEYIKAVGVKPKEIDSFVLLDILKGSDKE